MGLPVRLLRGQADLPITSVTDDSRQVQKGSLFIARSGQKANGRSFIADAIGRGAVAVLVEDEAAVANIAAPALLTTPDAALATALLAERFFGDPTRSLRLVGITGTNGKTTTAYLVRQILERTGARCALVGTVEVYDGSSTEVANLTTPGAVELSGIFRRAVDHGCRFAVMETSSHALHQKRVAGLHFEVGVFTNLTGDHLDYHATMDEYAAAKSILFTMLPSTGTAVVNGDDPASARMVAGCAAHIIKVSTAGGNAEVRAQIRRLAADHVECRFDGPWGAMDLGLPLIGHHNVSNALEACAACWALGLNREQLAAGLEHCEAPPGRLQPVTGRGDPVTVLVDYAHTDDALANVLRALRPLTPRGGRLRVVFGCGGDRDRTKRPRMAATACALADDIFITSDNPRTEDPEAIVAEIWSGVPVPRRAGVVRIVDRREAIHEAIRSSREGDIVLIAGKGHEDYQIVGTVKHPFDDRIVAREALAQRSSIAETVNA